MRLLSAALFSQWCYYSAPLLFTACATYADLGGDIRASVKASALGNTVSYSVVDVESGRVLAAENEAIPRKPASNMKLFTTAAALEAVGPDFKFQTQLVYENRNGVSRLIVIGSGDPGFADPELLAHMSFTDAAGAVHTGLTSHDLLNWWSDAVVKAGVTRVAEIVIDARIFDRECYNPAWPSDQRTRPYCAEVWGLNFHANMMLIGARATDAGKVVLDKFEPQYDWVLGRNVATVGGAKSKSTFVVTRSATDNTLTASGRLRAGTRVDVDLSVHDTPTLFAELLARKLKARGVEVISARVAGLNDSAAEGTVLGVIETPLFAVLARANTDSSNLHAEALLKRLGAFHANPRGAAVSENYTGGSWANGCIALKASIDRRIGADAAPFVISDGCGLSHDNRVTAAGMTKWLSSLAADKVLGSTFLNSLALAGESGTVKSRFPALAGSPITVRCKTGYINGVSCLSGVVIAPDGRMTAFSVLINGIEKVGGAARPKQLQEAIVMDIVRDLSKPNTSRANVQVPDTNQPTR